MFCQRPLNPGTDQTVPVSGGMVTVMSSTQGTTLKVASDLDVSGSRLVLLLRSRLRF